VSRIAFDLECLHVNAEGYRLPEPALALLNNYTIIAPLVWAVIYREQGGRAIADHSIVLELSPEPHPWTWTSTAHLHPNATLVNPGLKAQIKIAEVMAGCNQDGWVAHANRKL
jgi:hypothetical protein